MGLRATSDISQMPAIALEGKWWESSCLGHEERDLRRRQGVRPREWLLHGGLVPAAGLTLGCW